MNILFNSRVAKHNEYSEIEGSYRINQFIGKVTETVNQLSVSKFKRLGVKKLKEKF